MVTGESEVGCLWSVVRGLWFVVYGLWFVLCGLWFVRLCFVVCDLYNNKGVVHWAILLIGSERRKHFEVGFSRLILRFLAFRGLSCWIPRLDSA